MTILHIETSTTVCSVALSCNSELLFSIADDSGMNHAEKLSPFIQDALKVMESEGLTLDAVSVSLGPGSYTGLRIGVSTAKGLCYGLDIPLIAIDTLEVLTANMLKLNEVEHDALLCPMLDARRMEVYTKILDLEWNTEKETASLIVDETTFAGKFTGKKMYLFGNGSAKCKNVIRRSDIVFVDDLKPLAENMVGLAEQKFRQQNFENLAYFEPFYLKEFQATTPKKLI